MQNNEKQQRNTNDIFKHIEKKPQQRKEETPQQFRDRIDRWSIQRNMRENQTIWNSTTSNTTRRVFAIKKI